MSFASIASDGPLILAIGVSATAGLVSFLSPCVLPLVPGYVSYVTGLAGADLDAALGTDPKGNEVPRGNAVPRRAVDSTPTAEVAASAGGSVSAGGTAIAVRAASDVAQPTARRVRGRIVAGSLLFIAGFTVIFTLTTILAASLGNTLLRHAQGVQVVIGAIVIVLGLAFIGLIPGLQREFRVRKLPAAGLAGAPVLGAVFALGWVPCISPTLGAVTALSVVSGQTGRAVTLGIAYCVGLGLPFLAFAFGFRRLLGVFAVIRRNTRWVTRVGGVLLIIIGIALVTGGWTDFINWLRATVGQGSVIV